MKVLVLVLVLCLLLSGCSGFMDGHYAWEDTHPIEVTPGNSQDISAADYSQLQHALRQLVHGGAQQGTIFVESYPQEQLPEDMERAVAHIRRFDPIAAYAVEEIRCEIGITGSKPALAVQITYLHDQSQIRNIRKVGDMEQAMSVIHQVLDACDPGVVLQIEQYDEADIVQAVEDYALLQPQSVMETPQVHVNIYPETGINRVVEIKFTYQTSRESLKSMQKQVQRVFSSAQLYVSSDGTELEQLDQLYTFLVNRSNYKLETSITPAYHLLQHGVGDSRAFASVYAAMCRQAGQDCRMVSGTRAGEPWYWNMVLVDGVYRHVDILASKDLEEFLLWTDGQMEGYVWDFSAYPACDPVEEPDTPEENP